MVKVKLNTDLIGTMDSESAWIGSLQAKVLVKRYKHEYQALYKG